MYLNESSLHQECEYGIILLIQRNLDIVRAGTQRVKLDMETFLKITYFTQAPPAAGCRHQSCGRGTLEQHQDFQSVQTTEIHLIDDIVGKLFNLPGHPTLGFLKTSRYPTMSGSPLQKKTKTGM